MNYEALAHEDEETEQQEFVRVCLAACAGVPEPKPGELGELRAQKEAAISCMEAEHGGHDACQHVWEMLATERAARERAEAQLRQRTVHHKFIRGGRSTEPVKEKNAPGRCQRCDEAACICMWELCGVCGQIETTFVHQDDRAEKAESDVARLTEEIRQLGQIRASERYDYEAHVESLMDPFVRAKMLETPPVYVNADAAEVARLRGLLGDTRESYKGLLEKLSAALAQWHDTSQRGHVDSEYGYALDRCHRDIEAAIAAAEKLELGE